MVSLLYVEQILMILQNGPNEILLQGAQKSVLPFRCYAFKDWNWDSASQSLLLHHLLYELNSEIAYIFWSYPN